MTSKKILLPAVMVYRKTDNSFHSRAGYEVVRPRSTQVRLQVDEEVSTLFDNGQHYAAIIHAAMLVDVEILKMITECSILISVCLNIFYILIRLIYS